MSSASVLPEPSASDLWAQPLARENLSERAYGVIRDALMHGQLAPGARLLLRPTSKRFGISATPMREALLSLVSQEALTLDARGTVVVPTLTLAQLVEIRDIRADLEGRAAGTAARLAAPTEIAALGGIHAAIAAAHRSGDFLAAVIANTEFHLTLCRMGRLPILMSIVEALWVRCGPILSHLYDGGVPDWSPHPHRTVIAALDARDPAAARSAIRRDIIHGGKGLIQHIEMREAAVAKAG